MIVSEKSHQNLTDYIQFLFKKRYGFNINKLFLMKKSEIQVIISMIWLTRSSERIFNPSRYTGNYLFVIWVLKFHKSNMLISSLLIRSSKRISNLMSNTDWNVYAHVEVAN